MTSPAFELGHLLAPQPQAGLQIRSAQVDGVTDRGVNLRIGDELLLDVPCSEGYRNRAAGDWVAVTKSARPAVVWRLGDDPGETTEAEIRELAAEVATDLQVVGAVSWGTESPPGTGWQSVIGTFVRKGPGGKAEYYHQLAATTEPPPPAPPVRPPSPVTISPTSSGTWRGGRPDSYASNPTQGDWTGRGNRRGGWFYGTQIAAACAGKTVSSMTVTFTRARGSGVNAKRPLHVYLHDYTSPPSGQLSLGSDPEDLLRLSVGSRGTATLPSSWRTALASGSARGLAIYANGRTDYLAVTGGALRITFAAP
ncbi:hypothetical protein R2B67_26300 [Streptomyces cyaneofuscatus]|uniref:hypothetical protein n=1 Tax=Streptomyces cyaneofuscatus TaxID=66883 RepID=UPI002954F27E|nr:hypothetical protein [Streptomyces cyaneofuscatus]WOP11833.1 hypothetical protein R2B67_26300 [Streptomyces cyaneofuscatus]